jgi:large subunit ribosomal protein L20
MNAASRMHELPYSTFINLLLQQNVHLDRKILANLAVTEPLTFKSIVEAMKSGSLASSVTH